MKFMNEIPQRVSLVAQTKAILQRSMESGIWLRRLPSEVELSARLRVSRMTLRAALGQLVVDKCISAGRGQRRRILIRPRENRPAKSSGVVVLLTAMPLEAMPRFELYWTDDIREHLAEAGLHLEVHVNRSCFVRHPAKDLEELMGRLKPAGWVLLQSTLAMQQWFSKRRVSAVIAGSRHAGVNLPFVDIDHRALCRHAVGRFLSKGHRRLAFISLDSGLAGDLESEHGFLEGIRASGAAEGLVARHNGTPSDIRKRVDALTSKASAPTGFLVSKAYHALTVLGQLQRSGIRVPQNASVISRDSETYLSHMVPEVTCYAANPETLAQGMSRALLEMISTGMMVSMERRVMPKFITGETLDIYKYEPVRK
jgi:LacI family transcriptional regulator